MSSKIIAGTTSGTALNMSADTSGILEIQTGSTPTTAITVDASQNVGIGTSSPSYRFDCQNNQNATVNFRFANTNTVDTNTRTALNVTAGNRNVYLESVNADHNYLNWTAGTNLYFQNGAATIDSSGNLLVGGTANPNSGKIASNVANSARFMSFVNNSNSAEIGYIQNNSGTAVIYSTSSDYRLKDNIAPMVGALDKVSALKPVTYTWKSTGENGQGFIAHELQEVCPEAVCGVKDEINEEGKPVYQGIDTSFLVATLTAAIQELNAKVDAQAAEIKALKGATE